MNRYFSDPQHSNFDWLLAQDLGNGGEHRPIDPQGAYVGDFDIAANGE